MKFSYSVSNLRRLEQTPAIEIRPITVLLGKNSVGKSTYLRSFPLLHQSIETKTSAPVLWYGDQVDFGNFKSAVTDKDLDKKIEFTFELVDCHLTLHDRDPITNRYSRYRGRANVFDIDHLRIRYSVKSQGNETVRDRISIEMPLQEVVLDIEFERSSSIVSSLSVNGFEIDEFIAGCSVYFSPNSLFSNPSFLKTVKDNKARRFVLTDPNIAFVSLIEKHLRHYVDGRTSNKRLTSESYRILRHAKLDNKSLAKLSRAETLTFRNIYLGMVSGQHKKLHKLLDAICQAKHLLALLEVVGENLSAYFSEVKYIGPARARSERFYRQQELEVSEISPDGHNLPIFLASLDESLLTNFSSWVKSIFGYGVSVQKTEGHVSIILEHRGQSINVVDTGYGVSQVLPVLAQIWWMRINDESHRYSNVSSDFNVRTLAIEQPELHLHPAHQALLADVFADSLDALEEAKPLYFLVETHSESFINRLGELIEEGQLSAEDVQIIIFGDTDGRLGTSNVTISEFDSTGALKNWPYGFFEFS